MSKKADTDAESEKPAAFWNKTRVIAFVCSGLHIKI